MTDDLEQTPLHDFHQRHGARMVPFAGYAMPVQYAAGVMQEHLATRSGAGIFDVSHMGQITLRPRSGRVEDAAAALETLVPVDIIGLKPGRQRYALFTNAEGGIEDDLMVANRGDHLFLVVNAAVKDADFTRLLGLTDICEVAWVPDRALVAVQGPQAAAILSRLAPSLAETTFMDVVDVELPGGAAIASRSGYTGEDGFEISIAASGAEALVEALLEGGAVLAGLGARDSLRLEAGLCLYGSDIDSTTTPVEAALVWAMQKARRRGGARAGGFPGEQVILAQIEEGAARRRVGLRPEGRAPVRAGAPLFTEESGGSQVGMVTSGTFGPTLGAPVAMGYVPAGHSEIDTLLFAEVRGKRHALRVAAMPFVTPGYKR